MKRTVTDFLNRWKMSVNRKPLILRGARQVGKTYILKEFGGAAFPRYHYVNFEKDEKLGRIFEQDLKPDRILDELQFYLDRPIDRRLDLVILDEIQRNSKALTSLKYFSEEMPEMALCAAGSLLGVALQPDSFPVGKIQFLDMYPLSFDEFLDGVGKERLAELIRKRRDPTFPGDGARTTVGIVETVPGGRRLARCRKSLSRAAGEFIRSRSGDPEGAAGPA
jgi:predicted AAA+ superfamily ATPase